MTEPTKTASTGRPKREPKPEEPEIETVEEPGPGEETPRAETEPPEEPAETAESDVEAAEAAEAEAAAEGSPGDALVAEVETLRAENEHLKDQMLRALAEAENTRRRAERDREEGVRYGISKLARDLLEVADSLALALQAVSDETREDPAISNLITGVSATEQALLKALEKHGITRVSAEGEKFDPNLHEAMFEIPSEEAEPGHVVHVVQAGYTLNGRLLRPARVGVAKKSG